MHASIIDLRYRMRDILRALRRNEEIVILYRGKETALMTPLHKKKTGSVKQHPFFGMLKDDIRSVEEMMKELRGDRYRDL